MNEQNYITVLGWFRTRLNLSGNDLLAFAVIYGFSQAEGNFFRGGIRYLETWLGVSRATVFNTLDRLRGRGLIEPRARLVNGVRFVDYSVPRAIVETRGATVEKTCAETAKNARENENTIKDSRGGAKAEKTAVLREETASAEKTPKMTAQKRSRETNCPTFDTFWAAYPRTIRKTEKEKCLTFWRREKLDAIAGKVAAALEAWRRRWNDPQFIPAPIAWLRKRPWEADCDAETARLQEREHSDATGGEDFRDAQKRAVAIVKEIRRLSEQAYYEKFIYASDNAEATVAAVEQKNAAARGEIERIISAFPSLIRFRALAAQDESAPETMF